MDFALNDSQKALEAACTHFAIEEIIPNLEVLEDNLDLRRSLFQKMGKAGLFTLSVPQQYGGTGIDAVAYVSGLKAIAKADAGIAVAMAVSNMVAEAIYNFGSSDQKQKYLPAIQDGACVPLSFAMTEPQAGSDIKAILTEVVNDPENAGYCILSGQKQFITNGNVAGALIVVAKTTEGISAFLIDGGILGMNVVKKERKLGLLTADLVDISFEQCSLKSANLLGKPGEGLKIALNCLDSGRIGIAAQAVGIAEAAFEAALDYAKKRKQFGHPIFENQAIAFKLADMHVQLSAANCMLYQVAWLKDQAKSFTFQAAEAKLFCSEVCNKIADEALQIHGGYGYIKGYLAEKYFRDARATTIYEGTSEIQRLVISRALYSAQ
jgi:alkylation response protein AidB-like acyl-CoA dehydrogenase